MKKILFILISFFPLCVNAGVLGFAGAYRSGCSSSNSVGPSRLCQKYTVDGEAATCLDPAIPNPDAGIDLNETTLTVNSGAFAKGLIAIANYAAINGMSEVDVAHAFRIYTAKTDKRSGDVLGIDTVANAGTSGAVADAIRVGMCAYRGQSCSDGYLPSGSTNSGEVGEFTLKKNGQNFSQNGSNFTVTANVSIKGADGITPTSCSAEGLSCSISNVSGNSFDIIVSGTVSKKGSVKAYITFNGGNDGSLINEINLYSCELGGGCSSKYLGIYGYQRFIKINTSDIAAPEKKFVVINLPSICDSQDLSTEEKIENGCCDSVDTGSLIEDSPLEEMYLEMCGPIVYIENDCGADSCEESDYKDYTHSYVRQMTMKSIMKALDDCDYTSVDDYLDYRVNSYCGVYTSEKVDVLMPATAVSVSGQFFVFDKYNDLNCTTETSCLRQPYISGKIKATFFTDYKRWKSDYETAKDNEKSTYETWQTAVKDIKTKYQAYVSAKSEFEAVKGYLTSCPLTYSTPNYNDEGKIISYTSHVDTARCQEIYNSKQSAMNIAEQAWETSYKVTEPNAQDAYKNAVSKRIGLQNAKNECVAKDASFRNDFQYDFSPQLDFLYSQTSHQGGTKDYTMKMISNEQSVKYWPNTTTSSMSNTDYLGDNAANINKTTGQNKNIENIQDKYERTGVYVIDDKGNTATYRFPDNNHDSCSGDACKEYKYTNKSFTSIKTVSNDATDPYGKISNTDEISMIYFYRPDKNTFALMNSGEYKTLNYEANEAVAQINGLEVGYVYNLELTAYKGQYTTNFKMSNVGYKGSEGGGYTQELIDEEVSEKGLESFESTCNYCNYEMAFKRECEECEPEDTGGEFTAQFYYRSISLSDVNPVDRQDNETNWADAKGKAAVREIEAVSGGGVIGVSSDSYLALADDDILNKQNVDDLNYTYLADSSSYDIYDDASREFLEYEITLTPKDMQIIKKNSAKSTFDYSTMTMCGTSIPIDKNENNQYCFKCNDDMKECESSFVTAFFDDRTDLNLTRTKKWKYYVNGGFCRGSISTCLGGKYPDPVFPKAYLAENKNWP